jgi:hypothetical protein
MGVALQTPIAVTSGAFTAITASTFARYVEIWEDGAGPPAGMKVQMPVRAAASAGGGWVPDGNTVLLTPAMQPLKIGNPGGGGGPFVGSPAGGPSLNAPASIYCYVESVGATSTIQVRETN